MRNEEFFHFTRCAKAGFLYVNTPNLADPDYERKEQIKNDFVKIVAEQFAKNINSSSVEISCNVEFRTVHNDVAIADIILKSATQINLYGLVAHGSAPNWMEIQNLAYTYHIAKECGIVFDNIYIVNVRQDYVLDEQLTHELLRIKSHTKRIKLLSPRIGALIKKSKDRLRAKALPANKIDYYCIKPNTCPFKRHCEQNEFPDTGSILELTDVSFYRKLELYRDGILDYSKLPRNMVISDKSKRQIVVSKYGNEIVDKKELKNWITETSSQDFIWFLDFEADSPIAPIAHGDEPFTEYPFLYALHYNDFKKDSNGSYQALISKKTNSETIKALAKKFLQEINLKSEAPIVVGHAKRVRKCLSNMATLIPEFAEDLNKVSNRLVDMQKIFIDHLYYHPSFKGSYHLKSIIPKICPEISYEHIEIKSGIHAQYEFKRLHEKSIQEQYSIEQNLRKYAAMHVLALSKAYQFLELKI